MQLNTLKQKKHNLANANKKNWKNREKIHEKITKTSPKNSNTTKIIKKTKLIEILYNLNLAKTSDKKYSN